MTAVEPPLTDFIGAFLLAGVCGGAGASVSYLIVSLVHSYTPATTLRRTVVIGSALGFVYPVAWIIAFDTVGNLLTGGGDLANVPLGGGVPAVVASVILSSVFLMVLLTVRSKRDEATSSDTIGTVVLVAVFAVSLPVAIATLLPILFPLLA